MAGSGKGAFRIAIEDFLETFEFGKVISGWVTKVLDDIEIDLYDIYEEIATGLGVVDYIPEPLKPATRRKARPKAAAQIIALIPMIVGLVMGAISGAIDPLRRKFSYMVDRKIQTFRVDPATAVTIMRRDSANAAEVVEGSKDLGVTDTLLQSFMKITQPTLSPAELEILRRRGAITTAQMELELGQLGWTSERIEQIKALREVIPPPTDIIRLAVRDAFTPEIVQRFEYAENFPEVVAEWAEKQGLSREWALKYWYAHWDLPSIQQGFQMLHRLRPGESQVTFTESDLDLLMRTADIAPYFRDRLKEISYSPLTRVDVRRMFAMGILNQEQVYASYRDLGYNETNARYMTDFTVRFETQEERGLTREAIQASYKRGQIARSKAIELLSLLGFPEDTADFYLDIIDYDISQQQTDAQLDAIRLMFIEGELNDSTVMDYLGKLNLPSERTNALIQLWTIQRDSRINYPSRGEADDFYRRGIIDDTEYKTFLQKARYKANVIDLYIKRIDGIIQEDARLEAERAQAEAERLSRALLATGYQKDKAGLDVDIAELQLAIADIKVALHDIEEPDEITGMKRRIDEYKYQIVEIRKTKAERRLTYEVERGTPEV